MNLSELHLFWAVNKTKYICDVKSFKKIKLKKNTYFFTKLYVSNIYLIKCYINLMELYKILPKLIFIYQNRL